MGTVPTGRMERDLRKLYLTWLAGLQRQQDVGSYINQFQASSTKLISKMGGQAASLGSFAGFPVPKTLELSPVAGVVYDDMKQAAISASITAGLNAKTAARDMLNAGLDKNYRRLERLARTETVSAYWKNQWNSTDGLGLVMVWSVERSARTCAYCLSRDGLVVEDRTIRDHPNGRCTLIPTLPSRVAYKGTLQPGKTSKKAEITHSGVTTVPTPTPVQALRVPPADIESDTVRSGMVSAEKQRVALSKGMFNKKGRINTDKGWTYENRKAWQSYTEMGNKPMNALLRDPKAFAADPDYDEYWFGLISGHVEDLSALMSKNTLADDIIVARGVVVAPGFNPGTMKAGDMFADPAFLSTTSNLDEALNFASGRGSGSNGWTFITKAPSGTNALAGADYQHELIFKAGQAQQVTGVDSTKRIIYTEMIP